MEQPIVYFMGSQVELLNYDVFLSRKVVLNLNAFLDYKGTIQFQSTKIQLKF